MLKAELGKEMVIKVVNDIGVLAEISRIIADKGISILAVSSWVEGSTGVIHLVTDDNLRASDALRKKPYDVREAKVVLADLAHKPGILKRLTERLKVAKIDIHHLYGSARTSSECLIVFSCSDNDRAVVEINKK